MDHLDTPLPPSDQAGGLWEVCIKPVGRTYFVDLDIGNDKAGIYCDTDTEGDTPQSPSLQMRKQVLAVQVSCPWSFDL